MQIITCQLIEQVIRYSRQGLFFFLFSLNVYADVSVSTEWVDIKVNEKNTAQNSSGIEGDVEMDGVAVINDKVYIEGILVPKKQREFRSPKSGKTYLIIQGKDGNVTVTEK